VVGVVLLRHGLSRRRYQRNATKTPQSSDLTVNANYGSGYKDGVATNNILISS
jgi:hypothetical protein